MKARKTTPTTAPSATALRRSAAALALVAGLAAVPVLAGTASAGPAGTAPAAQAPAGDTGYDRSVPNTQAYDQKLGAQAAKASTLADGTSSGWNDYSCKPSPEHPRPVVLVHGTGGNATDNWLVGAPYLVARGYCVYSLDYGQRDGVPLAYGLGPIEDSAKQLSDFVDKVLSATGSDKVDIVGHSQGGMMPRQYLKFLGGASKVNALVGIAPSSHGTTVDGLTALTKALPPLGDALGDFGPALTEQEQGSDFLNKLNDGGDTVPGVHYTVISTRNDEVVTPYESQALQGDDVKNVVVQDLCSSDSSEHLAIGLTDKVALHEVANALDPDHATPTTCDDAN